MTKLGRINENFAERFLVKDRTEALPTSQSSSKILGVSLGGFLGNGYQLSLYNDRIPEKHR